MGVLPMPGMAPDNQQQPPVPFTMEDFGGLDTKAKRPAVTAKDFPWIQNWMPIGPGNMRTLWDNQTPIYTTAGGRTIIHPVIYNIGSTRYAMLFLDDGSAVQVDLDTHASTSVASAGTFYGGTLTEAKPAAAQYQSKYLVICSEKSNDAYWVWNGTVLFKPGSLGPTVTMLNSGKNYSSAPTITAFGGSGSGATFTGTVANGAVTDVTVTNAGTGYVDGDQVTLIFSGGGSDTQARATATVDTSVGGVGIVTVTNGGSNYSAPLVAFSGGAGTGAKAFVSGAANGVVTEITVTDGGSGYTSNPTVTITDSGGGAGSGATAICEIRKGVITAITVNSGGSGYTGAPDVVISLPNDLSFPAIQAEAVAQITAGVVSGITITNHGLGYKSASVSLEGGNNAANASVTLMPYGIAGRTIETYQNQVWVGAKTKMSETGPGSLTDFSAAGGGGSTPVINSFLREHISRLIQSNGFLYRLGDSSIDTISNVQTNATSGITTFNTSNVDPQVGTDWQDSVVALGRAIVFANTSGVYALYGGAAEKVSSPLDGLFATLVLDDDGHTPTAAVATIYGIRVYILHITAENPFTGAVEPMLCMWDGQRWFVGSQTLMPHHLATQEINSELTCWGTTDTQLYRLFQTPSATLNKVFQTKLLAEGGIWMTTEVMRIYFLAQSNQSVTQQLSIMLDNEKGSAPSKSFDLSKALTFNNNLNQPIQFIGAGALDLNFTSRGLTVQGYSDNLKGRLVGATVATLAEDVTMLNFTLWTRQYASNS